MKATTHAIYIAIILILACLGGCMGYKYFTGRNCPEIAEVSKKIDTIKGNAGPYTPIPTDEIRKQDQSQAKITGVKKSAPAQTIIHRNQESALEPKSEPLESEWSIVPEHGESTKQTDPIRQYNDSLMVSRNGDTVARIWVADMLQGNRITDRQWRYEVYSTETRVQVKRANLYAGFAALGNGATLVKWAGLSIGYQPKRQKTFFILSGGPMDKQFSFQGTALFNLRRQ